MGEKNPTHTELDFFFLWHLECYYFHFLLVYFFSPAHLRAPCVPPIGVTHAQPFSRQKQWWETHAGRERGRWEATDPSRKQRKGKEADFSRQVQANCSPKGHHTLCLKVGV